MGGMVYVGCIAKMSVLYR